MSEKIKAGDLVRLDFSPQAGHETRGWRPALVLSPDRYHNISNTAIVCPITSNIKPWDMKAILPDNLAAQGAVLLDQVVSVDRRARGLHLIGHVPDDFLQDVLNRLGVFLGIIR